VERAKELGHEIFFLKYEHAKGKEKLIDAIQDVDALIVGTEPVDKDVLKNAHKLKVIAKHGIGVDNIDLEEAQRCGIQVVNAPGTNSTAVAEFTWTLILNLIRDTELSMSTARSGEWNKQIGFELYGKTLGIIGFGQIGKKVAVIGLGFGMTVIAFDPFFDEVFGNTKGIKNVELENLLQKSDIVTLHTALTPETHRLIGREELSLMKKTSFLINVARGGIVDETALYWALNAGEIRGAAFDVFEKEPPSKGNPLFTLKNFLSTPHTAGYTFESLERMGLLTVESIHKVLQGEDVPNKVV